MKDTQAGWNLSSFEAPHESMGARVFAGQSRPGSNCEVSISLLVLRADPVPAISRLDDMTPEANANRHGAGFPPADVGTELPMSTVKRPLPDQKPSAAMSAFDGNARDWFHDSPPSVKSIKRGMRQPVMERVFGLETLAAGQV